MKKHLLNAFDKISLLALVLAVVIAATCLLLPGEVTAAWDGTVAANFQSGAGTAGNPYIIATPAQLAKFLTGLSSTVTYEGQYFALNGNIDMTGGTWDVTDTNFCGTLDGRGYTITADCPFLGDVGTGGTVRGLNYVCTTMVGRSLLCMDNVGTIYGCAVKGSVDTGVLSNYYSTAGLICARNYGTVQSCAGVGDLDAYGEGDSDAEAGMIGINSGTVKNCYAAVTVTASAPGKYDTAFVGPVVGQAYSGTVTDCAYDKTLYTGSVSNATGLSTEDIKGGAVMNYLGSTTPDYCGWANSSTFGGYPALYHLAHNYTAYVSGYIGKELTVYNGNSLSISFAKVSSNGTIYYCTDASVTDPSQFTAYNNTTITISGDTTVSLAVKYNGEFGTVTRQRFISLPGGGTESNPYIISQKYQLWLPELLPTGYFKLANDLTFSDSDFATTGLYPGGWDPIASFTGTFDGQGYAIYNLKGFKGGLFENVGDGGTVKNLRMIDHRLVGPGRLGAVADSNNGGTISRCYTKSAFTLSDLPSFGSSGQVATVGGVVGYNYGTVEYCRNDGIVYATTTMGSSSPHIGGIVGDGGDIHHCVNTGDLIYGNASSNSYADYVFVGGIAGMGRVDNSKAVQDIYINDGTDYSPYAAGISAWYSTGSAYNCVAKFNLHKNATFGASVYQVAFCTNISNNCYGADKAQLPSDCEELTFDYGGNWWVSNEGVMPQGVIDADGHAWVLKSSGQILPTCTAKGDACLQCLICGAGSESPDHMETISALGHRYSTYTSNNDATCQADGTKTASCDRDCGSKSTVADEGSKTACNFTQLTDQLASAANCTDAAAYYAACAFCGTVSDTVTLPSGQPNGHSWVAATCTVPETCSVCNATQGKALGHSWVEATCTDPKVCSACEATEGDALGHSWADATCTAPKTCSACSATEGDALGHSWADATCTAPKTCPTCGTTEGEALGHSWVDADCDTPKTCSVCSATEGEALGHTWADADCVTPKTCSVCSATEGEALGHTWVDADCDTPKTCSVCSATEGEALGHTWVAADCDTPKTCSVCSATEGEALGHTWVAADCDTPKTCSVCSAIEGEALGHTWVAADCDTPKTCSVCSATEGAALGHDWVAADCDTPKTCSVCSTTEGEALGHIWGNADCYKPKTCQVCLVTEGEPAGHNWQRVTCTAPKTCSRCSATEGEALGHNWVEASCTVPKICSNCGSTEGEPTGHNNWIAATCTNPKTCADCDFAEGAALGHTWVAADCDTPKTCSVCSATEGAALGHSWVDADCDTPKTCSVCSATEGAALGHSWVAADCDTPKTCSVCSATEGEALGHDWKDADCITPKTCKRCATTEGEALGHSFSDATCTEPKICGTCNAREGLALGHSWVDADCDTPKTCSVCSATEGAALGHNFVGGICNRCEEEDPNYVSFGIVTQPESVSVPNGATAETTVKAVGDGLTYTWYFTSNGSSTKFSKSSITTATYSTTMNADRDGRKVYCVITDVNGSSITTATVTLSMEKTPLAITQQPADVTVVNGASAKTAVKATGEGLKYTWYFTSGGSSTKFSKSSITTATYSTTMNADRDGRQVYCVITDTYGQTITSNTVTLSMKDPAIVITAQPQSVEVTSGATAKTSVVAEGEGLTYTWYYANKGKTSFTKSSYTTATYSTTMDLAKDGRRVYCKVTDKYGNTVKTATATLTMEKTPLVIVTQPENVTVGSGATAKTSVVAQGDGLTYTWYFTSGGASTKFSKSSITTAAYSTTMNADRSGRKIYCVVSDQYGNSVKTNTVTLSMVKTPLAITQQPANVQAADGAKAATTVAATGDGLTYTWYFTSGGSSTKFSKSSITSATYSTTMDSSRDGRQVYCVITDAYGESVTTDTVTLTMKSRTPLVITQQPVSVSAANGKTASTTVNATGDGLTYTWYYTTGGTATKFYKSSTTTATYSTTMDSSRDGRKVYCVVTDTYGNTVKSNTVTLSMN